MSSTISVAFFFFFALLYNVIAIWILVFITETDRYVLVFLIAVLEASGLHGSVNVHRGALLLVSQ